MFYDKSIASFDNNGKKVSLKTLTIPKFFELIFVQIIGTVNTIMLSGYSENAVAASGVAESLISVATAIIQMIVTGTVIVMGVELGKDNKKSAAKIAGSGLSAVAAISVIIGLGVTLFSRQLMFFMNTQDAVKEIAVGYLRIKTTFLVVTATMNFFSSLLICNGYAACSLAVGAVGNLLNILFGYIILYSDIYFPISGANGVAVGGIAAQFLATLLGIFFCINKKCTFSPSFSFSKIWRIIRVGVPAGMAGFSFCIASFVTTGLITQLGVVAVNTKIYVSNIVFYTSRISQAVAQANGIIMGRYRGKEMYDKIRRLYWQNLRVSVLFNGFLSLMVLILHKKLLTLFTSSEQIINSAWLLFAIDLIVEISRAVNHISENSLNANGDAAICFVTSVASCWIFSVLFGYIFSVVLGMGIAGIWIAYASDETFKAIIYLIRWKSGKWQGKKV